MMKEGLLRALREAGDAYVSGSNLCARFGVSRQAVWKSISVLKENGYEIQSVPNKGYRLAASPDRFYGPDLLSRLPEDAICHQVECFEEIDSTNTRAKQLAEAGAKEGLLVVSERQTAGRGRRGRSWESEPGEGIYMSLLLRPKLPPSKISGLTLLAALAVSGGIEQACGIRAEIKWPNDVVLAGKKVCGILTEMGSEENYTHYVVVGIGINANMETFPKEIAERASSIFMHSGEKVCRPRLAAAVVDRLCRYYLQLEKDGDLASFVEEYNKRLVNMGREVRVYHGMVEDSTIENTDTGVARGIDREGALLVETEDGEKRVFSGEVSVRGVAGYV